MWSNPCYALDPLWKTVRSSPKSECASPPECFANLLERRYENPGGNREGYANRTYAEYFKEHPYEWSKLVAAAQARRKSSEIDHDKFYKTFADLKPNFSGLKAVYWAVEHIWKQRWQFRDETNISKRLEFISKAEVIDQHLSRLPIKKGRADISLKYKRLEKDDRFRYLVNAKESVDKFWTFRYLRSIRRRYKSNKEGDRSLPYTKVPGFGDRLEIYSFQLGYMIFDCRTEDCGIFFWKDHDRLVTTLNAVSNLHMYFALYDLDDTCNSKRMLMGFNEIMDTVVEAMRRSDSTSANKICRALDVANNMFVASLATDVNSRGYDDQKKKIDREELNKVIDVQAVMKLAKKYGQGVTEAFELLKVYKLLPCPDFCPYSVVKNLEEKFAKKNSFNMDFQVEIGGGSWKGDTITSTLDEFRRYSKRNKILTFFNAHKRFPGKLRDPVTAPLELLGYPSIRERNITVDNVDHIDIAGSFMYTKFDGVEYELVKDKTTAPAWKSFANSRIENNQVMQYLFDKRFLDQSDIRHSFEVEKYSWKKQMSIALKPEAKKPSSRAFFMAPDPPRRANSEMEHNVSVYVREKNGSSQGKSDMDMNRKLFHMTNEEMEGYRLLLLSFDLASFSGSQDIKFKRFGLEGWAEVFGEPWIKNLEDLFTDYELKWDKFNINESMKLFGNDLEGFNGRLNTDIHLDVMGYAIYKLRQAQIVHFPANMECLIDDGLLGLQVPEDDFDELCAIILKVIEAVYNAAGLEISWDKTYASSVTCQYLNRVFCCGEEITGGAKAYLRIGKLNEAPIPTIRDHISAHEATARGAIKACADHRLVYHKYMWEVVNTIVKWTRIKEEELLTDELAVGLFTPVGLGGLGCVSSFQLSSNQTFDPFNQGVGNLIMLGRCEPRYAPYINARLNAKMRDMPCQQVLNAPTALRYAYRTLNLRRFANAAREVVIKKSVNPFVNQVAELLKTTTGSPIVDIFCQMQVVHDVTRECLAGMDPALVLDKILGKLQNSSTAAGILGWRTKIALDLVNRSEARTLIKELAKGKLVLRA